MFDSRDPDGKVTLDEWRQYYADLSASVDTDDYWSPFLSLFKTDVDRDEMMKACWKM